MKSLWGFKGWISGIGVFAISVWTFIKLGQGVPSWSIYVVAAALLPILAGIFELLHFLSRKKRQRELIESGTQDFVSRLADFRLTSWVNTEHDRIRPYVTPVLVTTAMFALVMLGVYHNLTWRERLRAHISREHNLYLDLKIDGHSWRATPIRGRLFTEISDEAISLLVQYGNVTDIDLSNYGVKQLPESITQLTSLQTLDLFSNDLSTLPEKFGQLTSLQTLELDDNMLPAELLNAHQDGIDALLRYLKEYEPEKSPTEKRE